MAGTDGPGLPGPSTDATQVVGAGGDGALVIIPTYNERDNLPIVVGRLRAALSNISILVVDDGSPDGTGDIAAELASRDERVFVIHRTEKTGLGTAYVAGFEWGLARSYRVLIEMDADGSHSPEQLHRLLDRINEGYDLVIGSRYVKGGQLVNWPLRRKILSAGANIYARVALGAPVRDITAGFRAYRREVLEKLDLDAIESHGYVFQIDLAWRTYQAGFHVSEVPITFVEREVGESKMSGSVMGEAFMQVARWGLDHRLHQLGIGKPTSPRATSVHQR